MGAEVQPVSRRVVGTSGEVAIEVISAKTVAKVGTIKHAQTPTP